MSNPYESFTKKKAQLKLIEESASTLRDGSCLGCNDTFTKVAEVFDTCLCESCIGRVYEQIQEHGHIEQMDYEKTKQLLLEYIVYFDMDKMKKEADKSFKGDVMALLKTYKVSVYKMFDDRIYFQTFTLKSKSARLNKLMLDFDGQYATSDAALKATPDADGTMADLKVIGKGLITPPNMSQAHANPTTPVKTPPLQPAHVTPTPTPKAPDVVVNLWVLGKECKATQVDESPTTLTFKIDGLFGSLDHNYLLPKSEIHGNLDKAVRLLLADNLGSVTNQFIKQNYTFSVYGESFDAIINDECLGKKDREVIYTLDWANGFLVAPKNKTDLELKVTSEQAVMKNLMAQATKKVKDLQIVPKDYTFNISNMKVDLNFKAIQKDKFEFEVQGTISGRTFSILLEIDDYNRNEDIIFAELEDNFMQFGLDMPKDYDLTITDPYTSAHVNFKCHRVPKSYFRPKGNLAYTVVPTDSSLKLYPNINLFVEIPDLKKVDDVIRAEILQYVQDNPPADLPSREISASKQELLSRVASTPKELLLDTITDLFMYDLFDRKNDVVRVKDIDYKNRTITAIILQVSARDDHYTSVYGNASVPSVKEYLANFKKYVENAVNMYQYKMTDSGLDSGGNAFVEISITDKKVIDTVIKDFKLDEFYNLKKLGVKYIYENAKSRR